MVSDNEWVRLTSALNAEDTTESWTTTLAEYRYRPDNEYGLVHELRNVCGGEALRPSAVDDALYFTTAELAAIPIVKALVKAARKTRTRLEKDYRADAERRSILSGLGVSEWPTFMPSEWHWLNNALERWDIDGTSS